MRIFANFSYSSGPCQIGQYLEKWTLNFLSALDTRTKRHPKFFIDMSTEPNIVCILPELMKQEVMYVLSLGKTNLMPELTSS